MSGSTCRVRVSGSLPLNDIELENVHVETVQLVESLTSLAGTRPSTGVFSGEYNGAEESLWDSLSTPSRYKIEKISQKDLVEWVEMAGRLLIERVYPVMRSQYSVAKKCSELEKKFMERQEELIAAQRALVGAQAQLVKLQEQLLEKREEVITDVKTAAKEEMRSFSTVLKKECETSLAPQRIQRAVAAASEDRSCNIVIYGLTDSPGDKEELLPELWTTLEEQPLVKSSQRLGRFTAGQTRPLKISLRSREMQLCILGKKTRLRQSDLFSRVYISPDLTAEERVARGILVRKLKEEKERSPGKSFRIKGGEVVEVSSGTQ
eukprot:sb/3466835/